MASPCMSTSVFGRIVQAPKSDSEYGIIGTTALWDLSQFYSVNAILVSRRWRSQSSDTPLLRKLKLLYGAKWIALFEFSSEQSKTSALGQGLFESDQYIHSCGGNAPKLEQTVRVMGTLGESLQGLSFVAPSIDVQ
jgi:hypothetical protein